MFRLGSLSQESLDSVYYVFVVRVVIIASYLVFFFFFFNDPATPEIYPLPLHDALPILACPRAISQPIPVPSAAPPATSVGKCWPAETRSAATPSAAAYSNTALRVRCGNRSRSAITTYAAVAAKASAACDEGNERRLSRSEAATAAPAEYRTGRLRCVSTLTHCDVASVHVRAFAYTATWPRIWAGVAPSSDATPEKATTLASRTPLAVPAEPENQCNAGRSMAGTEAGLHGAQGGAPRGSPAASGMTDSPPAATT